MNAQNPRADVPEPSVVAEADSVAFHRRCALHFQSPHEPLSPCEVRGCIRAGAARETPSPAPLRPLHRHARQPVPPRACPGCRREMILRESAQCVCKAGERFFQLDVAERHALRQERRDMPMQRDRQSRMTAFHLTQLLRSKPPQHHLPNRLRGRRPQLGTIRFTQKLPWSQAPNLRTVGSINLQHHRQLTRFDQKHRIRRIILPEQDITICKRHGFHMHHPSALTCLIRRKRRQRGSLIIGT